jgi:hypothetical protein
MSILTLHKGDNVDVVIWSMIEEHSAVICACLPSLRPLLVQWIPGVFKSLTTKNNTAGSGSHKMSPWKRKNESYSGLGNSNTDMEQFRQDSPAKIVTPTEKASHGIVVDEEIGDTDWRRNYIKKETRIVIDSSKIPQAESWVRIPTPESDQDLPGRAF